METPKKDKEQAADVLEQIDNAKFSWFHVKTIIIAGMGFFCDSYDLFSISLVKKTIGRLYYPDESYRCVQADYDPLLANYGLASNCFKIVDYLELDNGTLGSWDQGLQARLDDHIPANIPQTTADTMTAIALAGTFVGQLLFGYLGDRLGRRTVFSWSLYLMVVFGFAQAFSFGSSADSMMASLLVFRFFLGMGIGGDYPLSATLMSEYSSRSQRGRFVASVFAMQGIGYLVAATFSIVMASIWRASDANPDALWRVVLAFGAVPTGLTMYARLNLPETPRFTAFVEKNGTALVQDVDHVLTKQADFGSGGEGGVVAHKAEQRGQLEVRQDAASYGEFFSKYGSRLFGTASCWFLLDIAFYSQNLSQPDVFSTAGWLPDAYKMGTADEAYHVARAQAIIACVSTVPGYWFTVFTIETLGRWKIQMMGFFMMMVFTMVLTITYDDLVPDKAGAFVTLYAFTFFFANWGPNATTFVVPAEVFPTRFRTLGHGMSAATGKLGAVVGSFGFSRIAKDHSLRLALGILTGVNALGLISTALFVPETVGKSLEELGGEEIHKEAHPDTEEARAGNEPVAA